MDSALRPPHKSTAALRGPLLLAVATAAVLCLPGGPRTDSASRDAAVVETACQYLLNNTTVGRQALVGSVWWPPLPVILRAPLVAALGADSVPLPSLVVSALFGILALLVLHRILRTWELGTPRWVLLLALALNPYFVRASLDGSSGTTILVLVLITVYGLAEWVARREIRQLLYMGGGAALMMMTSFETSFWLSSAFLILFVNEVTRRSRRGEKEATLIMALTPVVYVAGLWILMNWLIMGDPWYFIRSGLSRNCPRKPWPIGAEGSMGLHWIATAAAVLVTLAARLRGDRRGMCVGAMGIAPAVGLILLAPRGLAFDPPALLLCIHAGAVLAIGYMLATTPRWRGPWIGLLLIPLGITAAGLCAVRDGRVPIAPPEAETFRAMQRERDSQFPRIASQVLAQSRYAKVFVCGYDGFRLLGSEPDPLFLPVLDFNFNKAKDDYPGYVLFVLVHRPVGRGAMDSIHWKYGGIFAFGTRNTLYEGSWGDWRLFEIIEPTRAMPR